MKLQFIIVPIVVFTFALDVFALEVNINDTTTKSDIVVLPVFGNTMGISHNKVDFIFELNYVQFELLDIISQNDYALNSKDFNYDYDWQTRFLTVHCNDLVLDHTGKLFDIKLRILPRMDFFSTGEIFQITPKQVLSIDANNEIDTFDLNATTANIYLDTIVSNQTFYESISYNYPNPFGYETAIFFSIKEATPLTFHLYKGDGALVQTCPNDDYLNNCLNYKIYNSKNEEVVLMEKNWKDYQFQQGLYKLVFTINRGNIALGNYTLVFETNDNSYTLNMIYSD